MSEHDENVAAHVEEIIESASKPTSEAAVEPVIDANPAPAAAPLQEHTVDHIIASASKPVAPPIARRGVSFDNVIDFEAHKARIAIFGCGGAGNNTVTALTEKGIDGASTVAINTDAKHLYVSKAHKKVLIGKNLTQGLGAGGYPEVGKNAALESKGELRELLKGVDLVFITCGLGGGTGTGAAPVVARIARETGAIVIAAVTLPFKLEGARIIKAEEGLVNLRQACDTVIVIENQRLLEIAKDMPLKKAFAVADDLIATMIKGISETISQPSLVNLDYADVKAIMHSSGGVASIGFGESDGEDRAFECINKALNHPLLDVDYNGATGALVQVIGGNDMRLDEINRIGEVVQEHLSHDAQVIWGARVLPELQGKIQVITIITGVKSPYILGPLSRDEKSKVKKSRELGIEIIK
ncbi:MAG: cell division protein FtsZ [Candidatus Aenigmarchaeota archaeon]|nr:cell division protein FtsZ [Candidatus Aenigmarchaeota archaeon]